MDLGNTGDNNLFVPSEMNKTQLPTFTASPRPFFIIFFH